MATKQDFTEPEWTALHKGVTGSGLLVSLSDRDLSDSFGEVNAMAKHLAQLHVASSSELVRALAGIHGTGFGLGASPERVRTETLDSLRSSVATLNAKAPAELEPYRQLVLEVAEAVAEAKGGKSAVESAVIDQLREALGSA